YMYIHYIAKSIDTPPSNELKNCCKCFFLSQSTEFNTYLLKILFIIKFTFSLRSAKKNWEDDKSKAHPEKDKAHCLWDSITMTMKQITPTKKIDKIEGWEPDSSPLSSPLSLSLPHSLGLPSWVGLGSEEDSSRYASLTESQTGGPAQWAARARDKLAAVRRRSPASLSENNWEGLK
uniref:Testis development-related protein n=1 Tax=Cyprinus carpio TaxID=7962 RepID=A0A8C1WAH8_CYPCA